MSDQAGSGSCKTATGYCGIKPPNLWGEAQMQAEALKAYEKKKNMMIERFQSHVNYKVVDGGDVAVYL